MHLLKVSVLILQSIVYSLQQTIELFEYQQQNSVTNCTDGLLSGVDTVVFRSRVDYSKDLTMKFVVFLLKRKTDEIFLLVKDYDIQNDCKDVSITECKHTDENIIEIYLHIKATKDISRARLRGKLITSSEQDIFSEDQIVPEIYDLEDHKFFFIINGDRLSIDNGDCIYNVSGSDINIVFVGKSKASPFYIELSSKSPTISINGEGIIAYHLTTNFSTVVKIELKYAACTLDGHVNTTTCNVKTVPPITSGQGNEGFTCNICSPAITVLLSLLSLILVSATIFHNSMKWRKRFIIQKLVADTLRDLLVSNKEHFEETKMDEYKRERKRTPDSISQTRNSANEKSCSMCPPCFSTTFPSVDATRYASVNETLP